MGNLYGSVINFQASELHSVKQYQDLGARGILRVDLVGVRYAVSGVALRPGRGLGDEASHSTILQCGTDSGTQPDQAKIAQPAAPRPPAGHNPDMGISFSIKAPSEAECWAELEWLCRERGARLTIEPTDRLGEGWIARAVKPAAPAGEGQGREG
jgi:hypothetical protein